MLSHDPLPSLKLTMSEDGPGRLLDKLIICFGGLRSTSCAPNLRYSRLLGPRIRLAGYFKGLLSRGAIHSSKAGLASIRHLHIACISIYKQYVGIFDGF